MSVWFCIPSARPRERVALILTEWHRMGYRTAILRQGQPLDHCDVQIQTQTYKGWARSINELSRFVLASDPQAQWIVSGGDDTEPDPNQTAEEIAAECTVYFNGTFGVMQPTGDRWANGSIDRICGSPWLGREFCERMYGGKGPMYEGYQHMFGDEELQQVAVRLGVLWQRRDLIHLHRHYFRTSTNAVNYHAEIPQHMVAYNTPQHWNEALLLFNNRLEAGFPGHEPL